MDPQTYEAGVEQKLTPNLFDLTNHDFKGWATSPDGDKKYIDQQSITINANMTLYAVWEEKICTITFNKNADDATGMMSKQTINNGVPGVLSENKFTRPNCEFLGWATSPDGEKVYDDKGEITVNRSMDLYAVWARNIVYVTFEKNDPNATGTMKQQSFGAGLSQSLNLNTFEKDGYHFTGWAESSGGAKVYDDGKSITITSNITLYAMWEINQYTVTFDSNGGTGTLEPQTFSHGIAQNLTKNTFTRKNYTFVGWATSADGGKAYDNEASISITSNTTLYALWELNKYTVTFKPNGGTGTMEPQTFSHGIAQNLTQNTFTRTDYTFSGWATSASGAKQYEDQASFTATSDITLYAVWEKNAIRVTSVSINSKPGLITLGSTKQLQADVQPSNATNKTVTWSTSDPSIATVTDGLVEIKTTQKDLSCTITVTTEDGNKTDSFTFKTYERDLKMTQINSKNKTFTIGTGSNQVTFTKNFWISDHELTQIEWLEVFDTNPSHFSSNPTEGEIQELRPVEKVNWYMAIAYCNKLSLIDGLTPCYTVSGVIDWANLKYSDIPTSTGTEWDNATCDFTKTGYRLPTEAEWEYAARGGLTGDVYAGTAKESELGTYAWYGESWSDGHHEVKKKSPNAYGLYDMSGNVWEWCWDWYGSYASTATDPVGDVSGLNRVLRGGSWLYDASYCRASLRYDDWPRGHNYDLGFRLARSVVK